MPLYSTQHSQSHIALFASAGLIACLAGPLAPASAQSTDEEEAPGVPHILVSGDPDDALVLEFDGVTPAPTNILNTLFPQFAPTFNATPEIPTLVIATPRGSVVPSSSGGDVAEFVSSPLSGLGVSPSPFPGAPDLLNDDNGFEAEDLAAGADIQVTFGPAAAGSDSFFILLGNEAITNISGINSVDSFFLGDSFDDHPTFGLQAPADQIDSFRGAALIEATFTDANNVLEAGSSQTVRFLISNDPAAFDDGTGLVPEPATAGLLALGSLALARRRRHA